MDTTTSHRTGHGKPETEHPTTGQLDLAEVLAIKARGGQITYRPDGRRVISYPAELYPA